MKTAVGATIRRMGLLAAMLAAVIWTGAACEGGGGDDGGGGGGFVGTWALYRGDTPTGGVIWYANIEEDGTFFFSNNADGTWVRLNGTYSVADGKLTGPFSNPPTGNGRVEATITDNVLHMNFIEYWHTPNKVNVYSGLKQ